jgi:hypothetical protein
VLLDIRLDRLRVSSLFPLKQSHQSLH